MNKKLILYVYVLISCMTSVNVYAEGKLTIHNEDCVYQNLLNTGKADLVYESDQEGCSGGKQTVAKGQTAIIDVRINPENAYGPTTSGDICGYRVKGYLAPGGGDYVYYATARGTHRWGSKNSTETTTVNCKLALGVCYCY